MVLWVFGSVFQEKHISLHINNFVKKFGGGGVNYIDKCKQPTKE